jgi:4'-phosphopantetheinyl transferase
MMIRRWSHQPKRSLPPTGGCLLWQVWLDEEDPEHFQKLLSEDECVRAERYRDPSSAKRFIVARGILRTLLGHALARAPEQLVFSYGPHGKPELADGLKAKLSFNLSHSGDLVIFAIANGLEVGVDIEEIHPIADLEATAATFLSTGELAELEAFPKAIRLEQFFSLWTCKEAILKASGAGFTGSVKDVLATSFPTLLKNEGSEGFLQNKRLTVLDPANGFKGALACL